MLSTNHNNKPKPIRIFLLTALFVLLLAPFSLRSAKNAIGVRVARNLEHLSPSAWYNKYVPSFYGGGSSGPSSISLAGYEAVSVGSCASGQGETIYVNAANIAGGNLYTNIYIIACPIGADQDIIDIFDQLIENWDFNVNVPDSKEKARIQRDTKRLSDMAVLNELLENYRANISPNKRYPALLSGTYEVGKSISYWSSWNENLGNQLQATLPYPSTGQGWGPLATLDNWQDGFGNNSWSADMFYPTSVGIDYTMGGCRQITVVKGQNVVSWCEDGCAECDLLTETNTLAWPTGPNPTDIAVSYQVPTASSCRDLFAVQDADYSVLEDDYSTTAAVCANAFNPDPSQTLPNYIADWPGELQDPTAISRGIDYNNCEHIFVVKDNMWSEYTNGASCPYAGWTPLAYLDTIPETFDIEWPEDIQNPNAVSMAWDIEGHRHIYAFKENSYREYIDYNRPYVYQTTDNGLSYSICTNFETTYPSLANMNCGQLQGSNYSPTIMELLDQKVSVGKYFNYDISAFDIDGDDITWSIDLDGGCAVCDHDDVMASCSCDWLIATKTSQKNIKKIYGFAPDVIDSRIILITIDDGNGGTQTKSFNLDVIKNNLIITSTPVTDITIGDDYQYDVEAYDPQGYYPLSYSWTSGGFPPGMDGTSINTNNGLIFGTPINVGSYNVTATVQNSNPAGADTENQPFIINVNNFSIVPIPDSEVPHDHIVQFTPKTNPEKVNKITWSIGCFSAPGPTNGDCATDINYQVDPTTGEIIISVNIIAEIYDVFTITVTATSDLNPLITHSESFDIRISNMLCGNGIVDSEEECDDGMNGDDTDQCYDNCTFTYCGDGVLQSPNGFGVNEVCESDQACLDTFDALPAHCADIPVVGKRTCSADCTSLSGCVGLPPIAVGGSSTACASTNAPLSNYSCCGITDCTRDGCACCGRIVGASVPAGYVQVQSASPCGVGDFTGSGTLSDPYMPAIISESCKMSQSTTNLRDWYATTNHTTVWYQCWD